MNFDKPTPNRSQGKLAAAPHLAATPHAPTVQAMYNVIVYALPCLLGLGTASVAFSTGAGWMGAAIAGSVATVASFVLLRYFLTCLPSRALRWSVGLVLVLPTAALAYSIGLDALAASAPTEIWHQGLAIAFAAAMSAMAFGKLTELDAAEK